MPTRNIKMEILFLLSFYVLVNPSESARILGAFSFTSKSHQIVFQSLMTELASRGHEVVMITPVPSPEIEKPRNLEVIDVGNVSVPLWNFFLQSKKETPRGRIDTIRFGLNLTSFIAEKQIKSEEVQELLNDKTKGFDLVFFESCVSTMLGFSVPYDVPVIEISSLGSYYNTIDPFGAPEHPILYPSFSSTRVFNLSAIEKLTRWYYYYICKFIYKQWETKDNKRIKRQFGPQAPDMEELRKKVQLLLLNVHPLWDENRPVPRNVLRLRNLSERAEKQLPKELKSILDSSVNGVIYMSFGNNFNTSSFSNKTIEIFTKTFSRLPFDVIVRWNGDDLPGISSNVKLYKWLPQLDLLRHSNVKLFITQGGLQSTDEALDAGVPLIGMPLLGDQWQNVERYVHFKIGIHLPIQTLTEKNLLDAINTITNDSRYRKNVIQLRNIMRDQPPASVERAALWTEYILRNGFSTILLAPAANMPWTEYYELELVLCTFGIMLFSICIIMFLLKIVLSILNHSLQTINESINRKFTRNIRYSKNR